MAAAPSATTSRGVTVCRRSGTGRTAPGRDAVIGPPPGQGGEVLTATLFITPRRVQISRAPGAPGRPPASGASGPPPAHLSRGLVSNPARFAGLAAPCPGRACSLGGPRYLVF